MKKELLSLLLMAVITVTHAQEPPMHKPPSKEEKLRKTKELIQKEVSLTPQQLQAVEASFSTFFTAEEKLRKDNPPPPPPPIDPKVKEAMDKLVKERDESIRKVLTADQYAKFKQVVDKLRPPHPGEKGQEGPPPPRQ